MYEYNGKVLEVLDGDTIKVEIDLGFSIMAKQIVRLNGINAPELHGVPDTKPGQASKAGLTEMLMHQGALRAVRLKTFKDAKEKYGRLLADVWLLDDTWSASVVGDSVNKRMLDKGLAKAWDGRGPRPV